MITAFVPVCSATQPFPIDAARATTALVVATTTINVNLPSGIAAGNLLMIMIANGRTGGVTFTTPSGWTALFSEYLGNNISDACFYKVATGSEGSTVTVTTNNGSLMLAVAYRFTGAGTPITTTRSNSSGSTVTFPALTPSYGANSTKWIAAVFAKSDSIGTPSGFGTQNISTSGGSTLGVAGAELDLLASSETPGSVSVTSGGWTSATIAIPPG